MKLAKVKWQRQRPKSQTMSQANKGTSQDMLGHARTCRGLCTALTHIERDRERGLAFVFAGSAAMRQQKGNLN